MNELASPKIGCAQCRDGVPLDFDFTMAFQPIVDLDERRIHAHEALVRGLSNEPAGQILDRVNPGNRYRFDQACRVRAIELAARLGIESRLNINFLPNAVYKPELCIRTTLDAARRTGFPIERIVFEVTENEQVTDVAKLRAIVRYYKESGFRIAIDDFGAGYSNLALVADLEPDSIKLDLSLVRGLDTDRSRRIVLRHTVALCLELGIDVVAEGIETAGELGAVIDLGIRYGQGFYFARPAFQAVATVPAERYAR